MRRQILIVVVMLAIVIVLPACLHPEAPALTVGIITDMHLKYEDFCERDDCLAEFVSRMNAWAPDFVIELGDATDYGEDRALDKFEAIYGDLAPPRYYVVGNHELWVRSTDLEPRELYLRYTSATECYYSFDFGNFHLIVLDTADHIIGETQMNWLINDLASSNSKTFVFTHIPLEPLPPEVSPYTPPLDAAGARTALEEDGDVIAVFAGHRHINYHSRINGIDYYTLDNAFPEHEGDSPCSYSCLSIYSDGSIWLEGFGNHLDIGVYRNKRGRNDKRTLSILLGEVPIKNRNEKPKGIFDEATGEPQTNENLTSRNWFCPSATPWRIRH